MLLTLVYCQNHWWSFPRTAALWQMLSHWYIFTPFEKGNYSFNIMQKEMKKKKRMVIHFFKFCPPKIELKCKRLPATFYFGFNSICNWPIIIFGLLHLQDVEFKIMFWSYQILVKSFIAFVFPSTEMVLYLSARCAVFRWRVTNSCSPI